ncbi:hypothetical protein [Bradyrhizobium sp. LA6.12]|uniref:hypothetical protein n=1 Tax=unclassified Bradyrhizobium TaxID=2631580 RepID=UPI00339222EA
MTEVKEIELVLHTQDERIVQSAQSALPETVTTERVPTVRMLDIVSILVTATAAVKLLSALIELKNKWKARNETTKIEVKNEVGDVLDLLDASEEAIKQFVGAP